MPDSSKKQPEKPKRVLKRKLKKDLVRNLRVKPNPAKRKFQFSARESAVHVYQKWLKHMDRIEPIAQKILDENTWDTRDRAFFTELLYGTVRHHGRIQWILRRLSKRGEAKHPTAYAAAAVSAYQMLYLDRVPDFAAVDEAVKIAKRAHGPVIAGWVNAVLRKISDEKDEWSKAVPKNANEISKLAMLQSYPNWLVERWFRIMSLEELEKFLKWNNRRPWVYYRINRLMVESTDDLFGKLKDHKISFKQSIANANFFVAPDGRNDYLDDLLNQGSISVQDHSQGFIARIVNPRPGEKVLDFCAAPGGKSTHLAEICPNCTIVATDKNNQRLELLTKRAQLDCYRNIEVRDYQDVLDSGEQFDAILVDAPCTGTGVLARRPDLRWRRDRSDIRRMAAVQLQLLKYASDRIKSGGRIIYSTCSIEPEENEQVIESFLNEYSQFSEIRTDKVIDDDYTDSNGRLNLKGTEINGDGAFAAILEKRNR